LSREMRIEIKGFLEMKIKKLSEKERSENLKSRKRQEIKSEKSKRRKKSCKLREKSIERIMNK
jgi:hypothetical protein